jgi:SH3-like domain-containing protein
MRIELIRQSPLVPSAGMGVDWRWVAVSLSALSHVVAWRRWLSVVDMVGDMGWVGRRLMSGMSGIGSTAKVENELLRVRGITGGGVCEGAGWWGAVHEGCGVGVA